MDKKLKQIIEEIAKVLAQIPPETEERTIFLNKLESELYGLREIYTLRRTHQKI